MAELQTRGGRKGNAARSRVTPRLRVARPPPRPAPGRRRPRGGVVGRRGPGAAAAGQGGDAQCLDRRHADAERRARRHYALGAHQKVYDSAEPAGVSEAVRVLAKFDDDDDLQALLGRVLGEIE